MADPRELQILRKGREQGKTDDEITRLIQLDRQRTTDQAKSFGGDTSALDTSVLGRLSRFAGAAKGVAVGAVKEVTETLQEVGQATLAAPALIPGGKTFAERRAEIKETTGFRPEALEAVTPAEEVGKVVGEVAEFVAPAGQIIKASKAAQFLVKEIVGGGKVASGAALAVRSLLEAAGFGAIGTAQKGELDISTAVVSGAFAPAGVALKPTARLVSNFLFGPKGTSGFVSRFKNPTEVGEFLKSARREPGGKNVEDVVTLLNSAIKNVATKTGEIFGKAEEKIISAKISSKEVINKTKNLAQDALGVSKLTIESIDDAVLESIEKSQMKNLLRLVDEHKDFTTQGVLKLKRQISKLFKGTERTKSGDRVITIVSNHLNKLIEGADPIFRTATKEFAKTKTFLEKLGVNIVGKAKLNVEQTANKLFQLAKDLDNPFKREATEKLLLELEKRSGVPFLKSLEALATAENLIPQAGQGLRAGVIRELIRLLELGVSKAAEVAGRVKTVTEKLPIPKGIGRAGVIETTRENTE